MCNVHQTNILQAVKQEEPDEEKGPIRISRCFQIASRERRCWRNIFKTAFLRLM